MTLYRIYCVVCALGWVVISIGFYRSWIKGRPLDGLDTLCAIGAGVAMAFNLLKVAVS